MLFAGRRAMVSEACREFEYRGCDSTCDLADFPRGPSCARGRESSKRRGWSWWEEVARELDRGQQSQRAEPATKEGKCVTGEPGTGNNFCTNFKMCYRDEAAVSKFLAGRGQGSSRRMFWSSPKVQV